MEEIFVEVAVPVPLFNTFVYRIPLHLNKADLIGRKVKVPFKSTKHYGIILGVKNQPDFSKVKDVFSVEDKVFTEKEIKIIKNLSEFYISPIGLTVDYFVPNKIREKNIKDPFIGKLFFLKENSQVKKLTHKQKELLELLYERDYLTYEDLKELGFDRKTIKSLVDKGIVEVKEGLSILKDSLVLSSYKEDYESINTLKNKIYLFDEFYPEKRLNYYLQLTQKIKNGSIHIILPSVELCNIYYEVFSRRFKNVYVYNDSISPSTQWQVWKKAMEQNVILIGTVSSAVIPIKNQKILIVEEEDSKVYKSKRTPKIDIKRVAYYINKEKSIPVIFASSIPSLESFLSLQKKQILHLNNKPKINPVNIQIIPHKNINSDLLVIKDIITKSRSCLIVANKSYYSSLVVCERCGWQAICQKCGYHLSVHLKEGKKYLECGRCKTKYEYTPLCPECDFKTTETGFGKEKVEVFLKKSLPVEFWNKFKVVSSLELKTLSVGKFETVINLYPDFILDFPDFRSEYEFFKKVMIPITVCEKNYVAITNQEEELKRFNFDVYKFLTWELKKRERLNLPPFIKVIKLEIFTKNLKGSIVSNYVEEFFKNLKIIKKSVLDNYLMYIFEYKNEEDKKIFKDFYEKTLKKSNIKITIEVNPSNFQ